MEEEVRDAVFGNVGTTVVFRVGPFDAEVLETIFMPHFTKEDVVTLDKRQVYLTLMIDGVGSAPFSAITIPPIEAPPVSFREQVIASSRTQFTAPRARIENSIIEELSVSAASAAPADARMFRYTPPAGAKRRIAPSDMPKKPVTRNAVITPVPMQSRVQEELPKPFVPRSPVVSPPPPRPLPPSKSADDLKAILRTMTAKTSVEKEQDQRHQKQSLKGVLASVLQKSEQEAGSRKQEMPKPTIESSEKKPFEVPEDALRKVFKGET